MNKHLLYRTIFCVAGSSILWPFNATSSEKVELKKDSRLPNVLILLADDQGYADVSYHEHLSGISIKTKTLYFKELEDTKL
jgi:hypothetical protein